MAGSLQSGGTGLLAPPPPRLRRARRSASASSPPFDPPPIDGDGGRGDGDDGGGREDGPEPEGKDEAFGTAELGLSLALVGIATLFGIFFLAWMLLRRSALEWPQPLSPVPDLLWLGTALLLGSSLVLEAARGARAASDTERERRALGLALALGTGFLAGQVFLWRSLSAQGFLPSTTGYGSIFYALTGLHALHVLAGLGVLASLLVASLRRSGPTTRRLRLGSAYWHAMGAIWVLLFGVLYLAG